MWCRVYALYRAPCTGEWGRTCSGQLAIHTRSTCALSSEMDLSGHAASAIKHLFCVNSGSNIQKVNKFFFCTVRYRYLVVLIPPMWYLWDSWYRSSQDLREIISTKIIVEIYRRISPKKWGTDHFLAKYCTFVAVLNTMNIAERVGFFLRKIPPTYVRKASYSEDIVFFRSEIRSAQTFAQIFST